MLPAFFVAAGCFAQDLVTIQGEVRDADNGEPLPYATIWVLGTTTSTFSNEEGNFVFHIPPVYVGDSIRFSHLGYENLTRTVSALLGGNQVLLLRSRAILLQEVIVTNNTEKFARKIVERALKEIPRNYPSGEIMLDAYWRLIERIDGRYVSFLDASVGLLDSCFVDDRRKPVERKIVRALRSSDYLNNKGYQNRWDSAVSSRYNFLTQLLGFNDVRTRRGMLLRRNTFDYIGITSIDDRLCYRISVEGGWSFTKDADQAELDIGIDDYGIYRITRVGKGRAGDADSFSNEVRVNDSLVARINGGSTIVEFKEHNGKLYLNYLLNTVTIEDYDLKKTLLMHVNCYSSELFVNTVVDKVTMEERTPFANWGEKDSYEILNVPYNQDFWKTYNAIPFTAKTEQVFRDLSVHRPVEEQFNDHHVDP
jgi:CarboxypepD_reg-like domain